MKTTVTLSLGFAFTLIAFLFLGNSDKAVIAKDAYSQTAPQGMVLIETDSLNPYYISVIEEPNINWQVYLKWLQSVFLSYPEVYKNAQPKDTMTGIWLQYNDPMINQYFEHPSFQYYPITGVTWFQVQSYLEWKTDRLNEAILISNRITNFDYRQQVDESNFNIEAYIEGQYDPSYINKKNLPNIPGSKYEKRGYNTSDGIFFPHYRLPTEAEWLAAKNFSSKSEHEIDIIASLKKENFLDPWIEFYQLDFDDKHKLNKEEVVFSNNFTYGISEWLLNVEEFVEGKRLNEVEILQKNGWMSFAAGSPLDQYGEINEKDSIGRLRFRFVQVSSNNKPVYLTAPHAFIYRYDYIQYPNPYFNDTLAAENFLYGQWKNIYLTFKVSRPEINFHDFLLLRGIKSESYTKDSLKYTFRKVIVHDFTKTKRAYVQSNYSNPTYSKGYMLPGETNTLLGFRCVLPYTGTAVAKKYKVKW